MQALHAGGNQEGVHAQLPGHGIGDHIADNHPVSGGLQPRQHRSDFLRAVDGHNIHRIFQQIAEGMRRLRDVWEAHDGVPLHIVFRQAHGSQHVIHGHRDFYHRDVRDLLDQPRRAAPGENAVVVLPLMLPDNGDAFLQVAGIHVQMKRGAVFRRPLHGCLHPLIGGNPQNPHLCLLLFHFRHLYQKCASVFYNRTIMKLFCPEHKKNKFQNET